MKRQSFLWEEKKKDKRSALYFLLLLCLKNIFRSNDNIVIPLKQRKMKIIVWILEDLFHIVLLIMWILLHFINFLHFFFLFFFLEIGRRFWILRDFRNFNMIKTWITVCQRIKSDRIIISIQNYSKLYQIVVIRDLFFKDVIITNISINMHSLIFITLVHT